MLLGATEDACDAQSISKVANRPRKPAAHYTTKTHPLASVRLRSSVKCALYCPEESTSSTSLVVVLSTPKHHCEPWSHVRAVVFVEQSQQTLRNIYINALPGPLAWAPSYLVPLASVLSTLGATSGHQLLHYLANFQAPGWFPMAQTLHAFYAQNARLCDVGFDTTLSTTGALLVFLGLPAMDLILGLDPKTPSQELAEDAVYKGMLYSHVAAHWALLLGACGAVAAADVHPLTILGLSASLGCGGALVFTVAHELLHSGRRWDRAAASTGLLPLAYMHWVPSHIAHHRNVGKKEDAATARLGEPLYTFIPRSVLGNLRDGVRAELARLKAKRIPLHSWDNRLYQWACGPLGLLAWIYHTWGAAAAALAVGQAAFAIIMLEDVNYIEHYGLRRRLLPNGRYERPSVFHSWNANWLFTNSIIFSLQRHSDHHANAYKPFQRLEDIADAPQLPASYPAMMLLALFPGLFFDVMDSRAIRVLQQSRARRRRKPLA